MVRVGVSVRRIRLTLNRCWKSWWILDFFNGKHLFTASLLALRLRLCHYSFIPVKELNYRVVFSWKVLNISWLYFPFFFWKWFVLKMTKQEAFLLCQTMVARPLQNFLKFFLWISQFVDGISVSFLKVIKEKNL